MHPRPPFLLAASLLGASLLALAPPPAAANQVVVLATGNRLEVESALPSGRDSYHLKLVGGGTVILPAAAIRRVSNDAADVPREATPLIASRTGQWQPDGGAPARSAIPEGIPHDAIRPVPGQADLADGLGAPRFAPTSATMGLPSALAAKDGAGASAPSISQQARPRPVVSNPLKGGFRRVGGGSAGSGVGSLPRPVFSGGDPGKGPGLPRLTP